MLDEQQQTAIANAVERTMDGYYQAWVLTGMTIIGFILTAMTGIIIYFVRKHFKKVDDFPINYVTNDRHETEANAIRREMLTCQQGLSAKMDIVMEQGKEIKNTVSAAHKRIDKWYDHPPSWYTTPPGAKS